LPQLVWTCLPDGRANFLSQQWEAFTGIAATEQLDFNWLDRVIHPEDRDRVFTHWMGAVAGKHSYDIEYRIRKYDGTYRWFQT
ncbi:PAS domain-containing protein, partial [Salmonella enterica]|uniref:PAS domain-containing protein n=1 Tax=Salmonella enterica TaxID=28901 RepID=UPI003D2B41B4